MVEPKRTSERLSPKVKWVWIISDAIVLLLVCALLGMVLYLDWLAARNWLGWIIGALSLVILIVALNIALPGRSSALMANRSTG